MLDRCNQTLSYIQPTPSFYVPSRLFSSSPLSRLSVAVGLAVPVGLTLSSKVLEAALGVSLHSLAALVPSSRADLAVLISELESLDETDGFLDVATDGKIVDGDLSEDTLGVDDEEASESDTLILNQDTIAARDLHGSIGDKRKLQVGAEATLLSGLLNPSKMGKV